MMQTSTLRKVNANDLFGSNTELYSCNNSEKIIKNPEIGKIQTDYGHKKFIKP
jgi:hypothetical protein